jgi:poly(3-hydroxyalkanoate) synthetase
MWKPSIVGGNPAKLIRKRFSDEKIAELLKLQWWNWDQQKISTIWYGWYLMRRNLMITNNSMVCPHFSTLNEVVINKIGGNRLNEIKEEGIQR